MTRLWGLYHRAMFPGMFWELWGLQHCSQRMYVTLGCIERVKGALVLLLGNGTMLWGL